MRDFVFALPTSQVIEVILIKQLFSRCYSSRTFSVIAVSLCQCWTRITSAASLKSGCGLSGLVLFCLLCDWRYKLNCPTGMNKDVSIELSFGYV